MKHFSMFQNTFQNIFQNLTIVKLNLQRLYRKNLEMLFGRLLLLSHNRQIIKTNFILFQHNLIKYCARAMSKTALIVLAPGAEEMEFVISADVLRRCGVRQNFLLLLSNLTLSLLCSYFCYAWQFVVIKNIMNNFR